MSEEIEGLSTVTKGRKLASLLRLRQPRLESGMVRGDRVARGLSAEGIRSVEVNVSIDTNNDEKAIELYRKIRAGRIAVYVIELED